MHRNIRKTWPSPLWSQHFHDMISLHLFNPETFYWYPNFRNETNLWRDWHMAELSLETRCFAFGCHPQAAQFTGFLINHSDICVSPLPGGLPTSCRSLRSKARNENPFAQASSSEKLGVKVWWLLNTMEMKHSCFIFRFHPDSTWDWIQTGFILFLQYDTSSHFKLMFLPIVCDCSVANFSSFPWERALFTSPLLAFSSVDFYVTCYPDDSINNI